jgi:hypothetical protein
MSSTRKFLCVSIIAGLVFSAVSAAFPNLTFTVGTASASSPSSSWYYSDFQYRKAHDLTNGQNLNSYNFYSLSPAWSTLPGNPTQRHAFQPVHNDSIIEVDKVVDGNTWKYLAYDCDPVGTIIRLYYSNNTAGPWTAYSGNPILGPRADYYRWPSTTYVNGVFYMFVEDYTGGTLERWNSTDGIHYTFMENVKSGGNQYKNPFIWYNINDNKWYLYSHDSVGATTENLKVRSASSLDGLKSASDSIVVSRTMPFGSATMMYNDGKYWLLAEILQGTQWQVVAYCSTISASSGFVEAANSPILTADEACPMLFLAPDKLHAYLFTTTNSNAWIHFEREVYLNSPTTPPTIDLSNYQIRIVVNYGAGTSSGDTVYLNGHCKTDFRDVRFTWFNSTLNSEVECSYWIEQSTASSNATFWVKIPQITSNSAMYIYYGKSSATTTSSGDSTFEFFDDFSGNLNKWTTVGGTWQIQNGELVAQTTGFGQRLRANNFVFSNDSVHVKAEWVSGTYFEGGPYVRGQSPNEQNNGYMTLLSTWSEANRNRISSMTNGFENELASQGTTNPSKNIWYSYIFKLFGNTLKSSVSPLYPTEISALDSTFTAGTLCLLSWSGASENVHYDNVFVTKYANPEPTQATWYSEETLSVQIVNVDNSAVSCARADVGSAQIVAFHSQWSNGSGITAGSIYVNGTQYAINSTGWASLGAPSATVTKTSWVVTGVNCNGVIAFVQTANTPAIVWDQIKIVDGGLMKASADLGDNATAWFKAIYQYDNVTFDGAKGNLFVNGSLMLWSPVNSRWEYTYLVNTTGTSAFKLSSVVDNQYGLTKINDGVGTLNLAVTYQPFYMVSNSTVTELAFNSTNAEFYFTVSGPSGTTGFVKLTIAKTLMQSVANLSVLIDGNNINYSSTSNDYYWTIGFAYSHSTHRVVVSLDSSETVNPNPPPTQPSTSPIADISQGSLSLSSTPTIAAPKSIPQPSSTKTSSSPPQPSTPTSKPAETSTPVKPADASSNMVLVALLVVLSLLISVSLLFKKNHFFQKTKK